MPTYGYQCTRCENAFEIVQKITDNALSTCDECGGELRKKIFPVGIQFNGSGFYVNDYASGKGKAAKADTGAAPTTEAKAFDSADAAKPTESPTATVESKPAAAAPAAPAAT
jgi:putative FmdB family regulatory protein